MIIIKLMGGIGNQMFQYACGRALAFEYDMPLLLDTFELEIQKNFKIHASRVYELGIFTISARKAQLNEVSKYYNRNILSIVLNKVGLSNRIKEKNEGFFPVRLCRLGTSYLEGYWQSEKYFLPIEQIIRQEFAFKYPLDSINQQIAEQIGTCISVGLHVRRGDYVNNPHTHQVHGICSKEYYLHAMELMNKSLKNPVFFIFSDDIVWAKENLNCGNNARFIDHNRDRESYRDMQLMSLCKHHVIANSSFSWWGAWLSRNPEKIVIAPKKWFNTDKLNTKDIIPEKWLKI
ncbi:MAG: alpha-1,2-fucosyltransferase [Candidatus Margulisiibacteriota bacterium]